MSDGWTVRDTDTGNEREAGSKADAQDKKAELERTLDMDVEIVPPGDGDSFPVEPCANCGEDVSIADARSGPGGKPVHGECPSQPATDGGEASDASRTSSEPRSDGGTQVVDEPEGAPQESEVLSPEAVEEYAGDLEERDVGQDPLSWMPTEFVDRIDGTQAINRKGFEVLRFFYGVSLDMELQVDPEDNDHTHCRYKAIAERDGEELEAWGTSHVDRGDDPWLLVELAATRARKRAISVATGAGACAVEELRNEASGGGGGD